LAAQPAPLARPLALVRSPFGLWPSAGRFFFGLPEPSRPPVQRPLPASVSARLQPVVELQPTPAPVPVRPVQRLLTQPEWTNRVVPGRAQTLRLATLWRRWQRWL